jgi:hypothetical protein
MKIVLHPPLDFAALKSQICELSRKLRSQKLESWHMFAVGRKKPFDALTIWFEAIALSSS